MKLDLYAYTDAKGEDREWRELELERLEGLEYTVCTRQVAETADYMPEIFEMDDVYLYGFWGCERYYKDITGLLRQKIRFPKSGNPANIETLARMEHENAVSVHIRRKDYLTVASGARYMGICTQAYYQ